MLKRLVSVAAVVVGLMAWVSKAHAIRRFYGYMHMSGPEKCWSCDPTGTPIFPTLYSTFSPPYNLVIINITTGDTFDYFDWGAGQDEIGVFYELAFPQAFSIGDIYEVVVFWANTEEYINPCALYTCVYRGIITSEEQRVDIKMHDPNTNPTGTGPGPCYNGSFHQTEELKVVWSNGVLKISSLKQMTLLVSLYDVSGKLIYEQKLMVKPGETSVRLPFKGFGVAVIRGDGVFKTMKVIN